MANVVSLIDQILKVATQHPGRLLDEMVTDCPQYTWSQIFLQVDRMSRNGEIRITRSTHGHYAIWLPTEKQFKPIPYIPEEMRDEKKKRQRKGSSI